MRLPSLLLFALTSFCAMPVLHAHATGESSLVIARDAEATELRLVISLASASTLLGTDLAPALSEETFDRHRPVLLAAAKQGVSLLDADGAALAPDRVLASFREGHEVHLDFFFPPSVRPARLRLPLLAKIGREVWCDVTDLRVAPPARTVLLPAAHDLSLAP